MARAEIFKHSLYANASNNGISQFNDNVEIVGATEDSDSPVAVRIIRRTIGKDVVFHAEPINHPGAALLVGPMAGGSYVAISQSLAKRLYPTFTELHGLGDTLIKLHDRYETQADYNALSR